MKKIILPKAFLTIIALVFLLGSFAFAQNRTEEWFVADRTVDCRGIVPQKCLVVRKTDSPDWALFYSQIRGFRFRDGYTQKIRVSVTPRNGAPQDASAFDYRLVKTISRSKTDGNTMEEAQRQMQGQKPLRLDGRTWQIIEIEGRKVEYDKAMMNFDDEKKRFGAKICNGMGGNYEQSGANIKFSKVIGTLMACEEPLQSTENRFKNALEKVTRGKLNGDTLTFFAGSRAVLKLSAGQTGINKPLEGTKWALLDIEGEKINLKGEIPFLQLDREKMIYSGFSGCNRIFGKYETSGKTLKFSGGGMTKRACLAPEVQSVETRMTAALAKVNRYENKDGVLSLYAGNKLLLKLLSVAR